MSKENEMIAAMKRAATEAVNAGKPFAMTLGTVAKTAPLTIQVDQKLTLGPAQLLLTNAVRDYSVFMTTLPEYHETEEESGGLGDAAFAAHKHRYQGGKKWRVHLGLKTGEQVLLLRIQGGQKYIVLDRVEAPS